MRILALSNLYPPQAIGGYEQGCKDVLEGLAARGHEIAVLTSSYGGASPVEARENGNGITVHRELYFHWLQERGPRNLLALAAIERRGLAAFRWLLREHRPEVISLWNMGGLSQSLVTAAQRSGRPTVFHISDEWPSNTSGDPWLHFWGRQPRARLKRPVKAAVVSLLKGTVGDRLCFDAPRKRFDTCHFTSAFLRDKLLGNGLRAERAEVIHWGVRLSPEEGAANGGRRNGRFALLYLGQLVPHKGPQVALEAVRLLSNGLGHREISLTLAGSAPQPEYLHYLQHWVKEHQLGGQIEFLPAQPRERLQQFCADYDGFVLPSVWQEPFSIVLLEAMAAGLPVVATNTGGTPEVVRDYRNGLLCQPGNAVALAEKLELLVNNRKFSRSLAEEARRTIQADFSLSRMVERVEQLLLTRGG